MRKSGDKDFLAVLQSLETILQAQTKISKKQSSHQTPNTKSNLSPKKSNQIKTMKMEVQDKNMKKEIQRVVAITPTPKKLRKLYKSPKTDDYSLTPNKYSFNVTPKKRKKNRHNQSPCFKKETKYNYQNLYPSPPSNHKPRHNSPVDQISNENGISDDQFFNQNYTSCQLNTLCIFFLRWMKRCTEKIKAESLMKANLKSTESTNNKPIEAIEPKSLAKSNTISIERVKCDSNEEENGTINQIPPEKIEINVTPKSFKTSRPSPLTRNSSSNKKSNALYSALTPQQQKQNIDYLQPNIKPDEALNKTNNKKITIDNNINNGKIRTTANNNITSENNKTNNNTIKNNITPNNNDIENIESTSNNNSNCNTKITNSSINNLSNIDDSKKESNSNNNTSNNLDSIEEICKIDLEETSPLPKPNDMRKMPSIGESDLNNHPNSDDIHYDSYELSEKSLSLLPPHGEGEVTDFNPSNFM